MTPQPVYLYVTDTLAEWEVGHAIAHIEKRETGSVPPAATRSSPSARRASRSPRWAASGSSPTSRLTRCNSTPRRCSSCRAPTIVTPGAHGPVLALARRFIDAGIPVAAICGATLGLAQAGLLDRRRHTSNASVFLSSSGYAAGDLYVEERAVTDRGLITASGCHPVEFAVEIFRALNLYARDALEAWHGLYTTGEERHFAALAAA